MAAILNSAIMNWAILDSGILVYLLKLTHTCQDLFPPFAQKKTSLIHSDSTWWWLPSWNLPSWIQTLQSWMQKPCYLISDSLKTLSLHSESDSNKFNLTPTHSFSLHLMMLAILNSTILDSAILHKKLHSFILTHLDDGSHLQFCHVGFSHCHLGFRHLVIFYEIHSKTLSLHSDSDSNQFNLINLMMASIMNSATLDSAILHKTLTQTNSIWLKLIHSHFTWWC